jgi:outer membrane protein assembly factor BamB
MPGGDQGRTNHAAGASGPTASVGELWAVETDATLSAPVVAGGTVYVGSGLGDVRAYDARTGERRWQRSVGPTAGRPRVRDGRVYVAGGEELVALDAAGGSELWRVSTGEVLALLVASHGLYLSERTDESFVRRSLADGSERWRVAVDGGYPVGRPIAGEEYVYFTHPRTSGPWSVSVADGRREFDESDPQPTPLPYDSPSPQCYRDGRLYNALPIFGRVEAMATPAPPYDGVWERSYEVVGRGFRLAAGPESVYVCTGSGDGPVLRALSLAEGSERWATPLPSGGRPVVAEDAVLVRSEARLVCVDPADGGKLWERSAEGIGETVVVADDVVFTSAGGRLRALRSVGG